MSEARPACVVMGAPHLCATAQDSCPRVLGLESSVLPRPETVAFGGEGGSVDSARVLSAHSGSAEEFQSILDVRKRPLSSRQRFLRKLAPQIIYQSAYNSHFEAGEMIMGIWDLNPIQCVEEKGHLHSNYWNKWKTQRCLGRSCCHCFFFQSDEE